MTNRKKKPSQFTATHEAWIRPRSREWNAAWARLADVTGDRDFAAVNERSGEAWQYMGTYKRGGEWEHQFRHRDHPSNDQRWLLNLPVSKSWRPSNPRPMPTYDPAVLRAVIDAAGERVQASTSATG